jgi:hypothetical protein
MIDLDDAHISGKKKSGKRTAVFAVNFQ